MQFHIFHMRNKCSFIKSLSDSECSFTWSSQLHIITFKSNWSPFSSFAILSFVYFSFVILCRPLLIKSCLFLCHPTSSYNHRKLVIIYPMSSCVILCPLLSDFTHRKLSFRFSSYVIIYSSEVTLN